MNTMRRIKPKNGEKSVDAFQELCRKNPYANYTVVQKSMKSRLKTSNLPLIEQLSASSLIRFLFAYQDFIPDRH